MDLHRLAEARSLAYHQRVASRLPGDPSMLATAKARVQAWIAEGRSAHYAAAWAALLEGDSARLLAALTEDTESARALRQCSPFAGTLSPADRWALWRDVRTRVEGA